MPELPEVETIARNLRQGTESSPSVVGREITGARLFWERTLAAPLPAQFEQVLVGQTIENTSRRGKFLLLQLTEDTLIFHLRMSGDMLVRPAGVPSAPHDRLVLFLSGDLVLAFNDTRKFGRVWLVNDPASLFGKLGPEPLDLFLDADMLYQRLQACKRQIKPLLLDQSFLAGIGNIYSDEALYRAKIHPRRLSNTLSRTQVEQLLQSIREVLQEGIRMNGASIDWVYRGGGFQDTFRVYGRKNMPCHSCGTPVERILVGQRSSHFCPVCQPDPNTE
jgi:formamidopyrimidine-DNA glycosylase